MGGVGFDKFCCHLPDYIPSIDGILLNSGFKRPGLFYSRFTGVDVDLAAYDWLPGKGYGERKF